MLSVSTVESFPNFHLFLFIRIALEYFFTGSLYLISHSFPSHSFLCDRDLLKFECF